jgi:hypothetical protein
VPEILLPSFSFVQVSKGYCFHCIASHFLMLQEGASSHGSG